MKDRSQLKELRVSLGLTLEEVGTRLGLSRQAVLRLEQSEAAGSISVQNLRRVARSMGFEPVISLRPVGLSTAEEIAESVLHTMELEAQGLDSAARSRLVREVVTQYES